MINDDTIELLKECNAGVKMGVSSIDEVLPSVENKELAKLLDESKDEHSKLGNRTRELLNQYGDSGKEPNPIAKSMSWLKTNFKLTAEPTDQTVADLMTDGCDMGVKSLSRYLNKYKAASEESKSIATELIALEERMSKQMRPYL